MRNYGCQINVCDFYATISFAGSPGKQKTAGPPNSMFSFWPPAPIIGLNLCIGANSMKTTVIKTCAVCKSELTLDDFEHDPYLVPIGMMFMDDDITEAYYMFQHEKPGCGTSLVISVTAFLPAITEPIAEKIMALKDCCEFHCTKLDDLNACKAPCLFASYRRHIIDLVARKGRAPIPKNVVLTR